MTRWLLERLEVEGIRGINNEGDPLVLDFKTEAVNSISAPNGTGKSSIFDALSFALRGEISKLDRLQASEHGEDYYLNRFNSKDFGTVALKLASEGGGASVTLTVKRTKDGKREVAGPAGVDVEALLRDLNRDFVLLDHKTLQTFIDDKALDRGRAFAGLLGLERYSALRQALQGLTNTTAFNNHTELRALRVAQDAARSTISQQGETAKAAFLELTKEPLADQGSRSAAIGKAFDALAQIAVLEPHCRGKGFLSISVDECVEAIRLAEGGDERSQLASLIQAQAKWDGLITDGIGDAEKQQLLALATQRDTALAETAGALLRQALVASREVLVSAEWTDKALCPVCGRKGDHPLLGELDEKIGHYAEVEQAGERLQTEWSARWKTVVALEAAARVASEPDLFAAADRTDGQSLTADQVTALFAWRETLLARARQVYTDVKVERASLEAKLPPSLVAVTKAVEAARRLQTSWIQIGEADEKLSRLLARQAQIERVRKFLVEACRQFAAAETTASTRRLAAIEPVFQGLFTGIVFGPIKPSLQKVPGSEGLTIGLEHFFGLQSVSAQALLSESFRNAFAMAVYLAAASLYGGAPLFVVLDDVTSSFDGGHQFHLMEVIRTKFARPAKADGPQVILLSHDTLLEKLFNKNAGKADWNHFRLEGTAQTAVLPQSIASNHVKDAIVRALQAGQVRLAAPRIREYLEFKLLEVVTKAGIPVPVDFALDDTKKMPQNCFDAIEAAVKLHVAAGTIVLEPAQLAGLQQHVASITGNYLAHYATGQVQAFSASALQGVMAAIDGLADCFRFEHPPGSGAMRYYRSLSRKH